MTTFIIINTLFLLLIASTVLYLLYKQSKQDPTQSTNDNFTQDKLSQITHLDWKVKMLLVLTFCLIIISFIIPFILTRPSASKEFNFTQTGQIGDTIGGLMNPFVALAGVVITGLAFYIQYKANLLQRELFLSEQEQNQQQLQEQIDNQNKQIQLQEFITKYFELIKMHRDNVAEIGIGEDFGKKIFVMMIREFRSILEITKIIETQTEQQFTKEKRFIISYYALFFGVGPNSSRMLREALRDYDNTFVKTFVEELEKDDVKANAKKERKLKYTPFEGHQSRLGHYYRHLYQTVCYVDQQTIEIDKYGYVKTIRAQLTTHEQALLFINSITPIGKNWWSENLIINYRLVKNIPIEFFDSKTEIDLTTYFPARYFEHQE